MKWLIGIIGPYIFEAYFDQIVNLHNLFLYKGIGIENVAINNGRD
jgi:hypothetical protein